MRQLAVSLILISIIISADTFGANLGYSLLNENPIYPIPEEMTFDEYQDMNRRLEVGLLLSAIPIPGAIHSYAGEAKTAKKIRWITAGSIACMLFGVMSMDEGDWESSPYEIHYLNKNQDNEKRYAKVPIGQLGDNIDYKFVELDKHSNNMSGAAFLLPLGVGALVANYLYDYIYGIKIIVNKRDRVRFKYGKKLDFSFEPTYNYKNNYAGLKFSYKF